LFLCLRRAGNNEADLPDLLAWFVVLVFFLRFGYRGAQQDE
jgi:hypothetical protein